MRFTNYDLQLIADITHIEPRRGEILAKKQFPLCFRSVGTIKIFFQYLSLTGLCVASVNKVNHNDYYFLVLTLPKGNAESTLLCGRGIT